MPRKRTSETDLALSSGAAPVRRKVAARPRVQRNAPAAETAPVVASLTATAVGPSFEDIARLAYSYWEARGGQGGHPDEDWARAERELRAGL